MSKPRKSHDPLIARIDAVRRAMGSVSPTDHCRIQELRQALTGIQQEIDLRKDEGGNADSTRRGNRIDAALAALKLNGFATVTLPEGDRPEWAKASYPPEESTTLDQLCRRIKEVTQLLQQNKIEPSAGPPKSRVRCTAGLQKKLNRHDVKTRLKSKGWSHRDWAKNANVDAKTVNNFMEGRSSYPSTRKKLGDALGVPADLLP